MRRCGTLKGLLSVGKPVQISHDRTDRLRGFLWPMIAFVITNHNYESIVHGSHRAFWLASSVVLTVLIGTQ